MFITENTCTNIMGMNKKGERVEEKFLTIFTLRSTIRGSSTLIFVDIHGDVSSECKSFGEKCEEPPKQPSSALPRERSREGVIPNVKVFCYIRVYRGYKNSLIVVLSLLPCSALLGALLLSINSPCSCEIWSTVATMTFFWLWTERKIFPNHLPPTNLCSAKFGWIPNDRKKKTTFLVQQLRAAVRKYFSTFIFSLYNDCKGLDAHRYWWQSSEINIQKRIFI